MMSARLIVCLAGFRVTLAPLPNRMFVLLYLIYYRGKPPSCQGRKVCYNSSARNLPISSGQQNLIEFCNELEEVIHTGDVDTIFREGIIR